MSENNKNNLKTIEIKGELQSFIDSSNWKGHPDKDNEDLTWKDIDRTYTVFGRVVAETADGACGQALSKAVIRAEAGIGFTPEKGGVLKLEDRPLIPEEQKLLFRAVCKHLFKGSGLNEEEEKDYRDFLECYMHQNALYQQSVKFLLKKLSKEDLLIQVKLPYEPRLYFKDIGLTH